MPSVLLAPVPHDEATAFIKSKPVVSREVFDGLVPELKARAITVTGIENANVVQNVRDRIADLPQGADWDKVKGDIVDQISPWLRGGEEGGAAAERRAETLMRAHGFQAYSGAMDQVMDRQKAAFPYAMYVTAGDDKVRDSHAALNGLILPVDDPFWDSHTGPWEWGCRCTKVPMAADEVDELRAAEADKPVEERRVVEGPRLEALSKNNQLTVAAPGEVPRSVSVSPSKTFNFDSKSLRLSADEIQQRYSPEAWQTFEGWAAKQDLGGGVSVLDWMKGAPAPATPAAGPASTKPALAGAKGAGDSAAQQSETPNPKPETAPAQPAGTPVSKALKVSAKLPHAEQINTALKSIDSVHGDGDLRSIPITAYVPKNAFGVYRRDTRTGAPERIGVRYTSYGWPAMTTAHEVGHFIDHWVLGKQGTFASAAHADLAPFRQAISDSAAGRIVSTFTGEMHRKFGTERELWARAYAQYIAVRSGDKTMLAQLERIRTGGQPWRQWSDRDFEPIAKSIDELFRKKGWIK